METIPSQNFTRADFVVTAEQVNWFCQSGIPSVSFAAHAAKDNFTSDSAKKLLYDAVSEDVLRFTPALRSVVDYLTRLKEENIPWELISKRFPFLDRVPIISVEGRIKDPISVLMKMMRTQWEKNFYFSDIAGARVVVDTEWNIMPVVGAIHCSPFLDQRGNFLESDRWTRFFDGISPGKQINGYRALHLTVTSLGMPVEIQIRTKLQNELSLSIELLRKKDLPSAFLTAAYKYYVEVSGYLHAKEVGENAEMPSDEEVSNKIMICAVQDQVNVKVALEKMKKLMLSVSHL